MNSKVVFKLLFLCIFFAGIQKGYSQNGSPKKYQSLLWEISGKGMEKPSYLFGTMHVSNKMVFNLADSFYHALESVHTVALELNPASWQQGMSKVDQFKKNYSSYSTDMVNNFLTTQSFKLNNFEDEFKLALRTEPTVVNGLLYRSYNSKENFEEDTFLDLYIYQTARKSGKATTGVEDYLETERVVLEAYTDMVDEKKKVFDTGTDSYADISKKTEDAYRKGDLDLLDSLQNILMGSEAFRNKFLIKRNDIQAYSIDTLIQKNTAFIGVGAAHLPGDKGVIEILRKMGYSLRPIKLSNRTNFQQKEIDKKKVPVTFSRYISPDGMINVEVPGEMYNLTSDETPLQRIQYADMSNGAYYSVTRVQTYHKFTGTTEKQLLARLDSMLYENIPGNIVSRKHISDKDYDGLDILNKTRQGNLQRYQIWVTPFEILIFKMSGKEDYVEGEEATTFFESIQLNTFPEGKQSFEPEHGGFKVQFPGRPHQFKNESLADDIPRMEYTSFDKNTGNAYMVMKKSVTNYQFLEEDSFDLELIFESFNYTSSIARTLSKKNGKFKGMPSLKASFKLKDSSVSQVNMVLNGPHYYLLLATGKNAKNNYSDFFSSFEIVPFTYSQPIAVSDTFFNFKMVTTGIPDLDGDLRSQLENYSDKSFRYNNNKGEPYWPKTQNAQFLNEKTGESAWLRVQTFPKYFKIKDSLNLLDEEIKNYLIDDDLVLDKLDSFAIDKKTTAYTFVIKDTNTTRTINRLMVFNQGKLYRLASMGGGVFSAGNFKKQIFTNFRPFSTSGEFDLYTSKTDLFFKDVFSPDSITAANAFTAFPAIVFEERDISKLDQLISDLKYTQKNYFDLKVNAISELGYIKEKSIQKKIPAILKSVYENTLDTSTFKNAVINALIASKTKESFGVLKEIMLRDPVVFENNYEYDNLFWNMNDSLKLARQLYPDILHLLTIQDYKSSLLETLATLMDSSLITAKDYEEYYTNIYFDAKIALEKQQMRDENLMKKESELAEDEDPEDNSKESLFTDFNSNIYTYAKLLIPFYDKEVLVKKFFDKLLYSKNQNIRLLTATVMIKEKKHVPDSLLISLAANDHYRSHLYRLLKRIDKEDKFPAAFKDQQLMARSLLISDSEYERIDSVILVKTITTIHLKDTGQVFFYKYRVKKDDLWKLAFSGFQPKDKKKVSTNNTFTVLSEKALDYETPESEQFDKEFRKLQISSRKSGKYFYMDEDYKIFN